jgi:tetratricopeptide (TPR) repeat protein
MGLSTLTRPDLLPFAGIVIVAILAAKYQSHFNLKKRGLLVLTFLIPLSAMLLLVGISNYRVAGRFNVLPSNSGLNFYIGNNPNYQKTMGIRPDFDWLRLINMPESEGTPMSQYDHRRSRFFYRKGLRYVIDQPLDWMNCLFYKVRNLTNGYELPETLDIYTFREYSPVLSLLVLQIGHIYFPYAILLPLAVLGIYFNRQRWKELGWLFAMLSCLAISLIFFWNSSRYRLSMVPILFLLASSAICSLVQMLRQKDKKRPVVIATTLVLFTVIVNWPTSHFSKSYNFKAELLGYVGTRLLKTDEAIEGARLVTMARDLDPDNLSRRVEFANLLQMQGRFQEAIKQYKEILEIDPALFEVHKILGTTLATIGKYSESYFHLSEAIRLNPTYGLAHTWLGRTLEKMSRFDEAFYHYKEAVRVSPHLYAARMNLGVYLYNTMMLEEAINQYANAIKNDPNQFAAHLNMGHCFLAKGEIDKAIELYLRAKELSPHNPAIDASLRRTHEIYRPIERNGSIESDESPVAGGRE